MRKIHAYHLQMAKCSGNGYTIDRGRSGAQRIQTDEINHFQKRDILIMLNFDELRILIDHNIQSKSIGVRTAQDNSTRSIKACFAYKDLPAEQRKT